MKKILYTLLAVATLGLAAGCQREQSVKEEGPMVDVSFNVNIQGLQTKAFSDGTQAKDLYVAVYANRTDGAVFMDGISTDQIGAFADGLTATVKLRLVRGENYDIVFWAQAPNAPYTLDKTAKTLTVSTEGKANDELRDAFYGVWTGTPVTAPQDVTLQRPFAQINVLTTADDWAALQASGIPFAGSSMTFTAPTVLELTTGKATTPKEYKLAFDAIDPDAVNIPGYEQTHKYIAMNYVLAGERLTEKLNFTIYRAADDPLGDFEVVNVPFQRNYRTNVWGEIFTVEGEFHVTIDPVYEDDIDWPMEGEEQTLALVPGSALAAAAQMDDNNVWHVSVKKDATIDFTGVETDATGATVEYKSSNEEVGGFITNKAGEFTALKAGETTVTVNFTADGYKPAAMTFIVTVTEDAPVTGDTATFKLDSSAGWDNAVEMTAMNANGVTLTPGKGTNNNNAPKYYTSGDAVRFYAGNTLTISSGDKLIKSVKFTYSQAPTETNPVTADSGEMTADWVTWTGSAKSVVFTVGGSSGQVRISQVEVSFESSSTTEPTVTGIKVVSLPTKTEYTVGEHINWAGFKANAILSDQTERELASNEMVHDRNEAFADSDISDACVVNIYYFDGTNVQDITTSFTVKVVAAQPAANDGSLAHPFTPEEAIDAVANLTWTSNSEYEKVGPYYVSGKISKIANKGTFTEGGTYGNASFYISEDGTENNEFYCFRVLYLGNAKFQAGQTDITVGDEVVVYAELMNYNGTTPETVSGSGYLYSLNGVTEAATVPVITAGNISEVPAEGVTNATVGANDGFSISNLDNSWTVSATPDGTVVTAASWANDALTYSVSANTGAARQGKITLKVTKGDTEISKEITVSQLAGNTTPVTGGTTVTMDQTQLAAAAAGGATVTMDDVISFTNSSSYTGTVTELRLYKNATLAFSAASGYSIAQIEFTCTKNGTTKEGPGCFGAGAPSGYSYSGATGTWTGNETSVTFTATDNQVRIKELKVTYVANN